MPERFVSQGRMNAGHRFDLTARPVAHRGLHASGTERVENSLAAFSAGIEKGFALELDVQLSGDGKAVVFHDETLDRLTEETGSVADRTSAGLGKIRLNGTEQTIPSLQSVLDLIGGRVPVFVELKGERDHRRKLSESVAAALSVYEGPCAVMSFDPRLVADMKRLLPDTPKGLVFMSYRNRKDLPLRKRMMMSAGASLWSLQPDFIAYNQAELPSPAPLFWKKMLNIPLLSWTVRSAERADAISPWADQIIFEDFDPDVQGTTS